MAATCAGVACFGVVAASPQKPRALMMSAGVCGFASAFSAGAATTCFDLPGLMIWASAEASWTVWGACGFERGVGTASVDLAGTAAAIRPAGADLSLLTG